MTRTLSILAALVVVAPLSLAVLMQAAAIFAA